MRRAARPLGTMLGLGLGFVGACFQPPQPAVQFSCEPQGAAECPEGYTCQADGCCHRDGSSFEEHEGECQLGGAPPEPTGVGTFGATEAPSTTDPPLPTSGPPTDASGTSGTAAGSSGPESSGSGSSGAGSSNTGPSGTDSGRRGPA